MLRNTGRRKEDRGRRKKRLTALPARIPAGRFRTHCTHCSRPAYISVRFPSHEISRGWAHGAWWLSEYQRRGTKETNALDAQASFVPFGHNIFYFWT